MGALVTTRSDSLLGRQVCGEYIVQALIRTEPLATVYSATTVEAGAERYVVRVLPRTRGGNPVVFRAEMDRVQAIPHRAIAPIVAYSVAPWGITVVSHAVGEGTLRQRLATEGPLSDAETAWLICEVAAALDALHSAHPPIVHGALCPQNITLGSEGASVWVEASGLVHALAAADWLSPAAQGFGEAGYLSPDDVSGTVDPGSDVFVLASIAYECLTGVRAFTGADVDHAAVFTRSPPLVRMTHPQAAPEVDAALARAWRLQGLPPFESASAFAMEFARGLMAESGRVTPVVSLPPGLPKRSGMRPTSANDDADPDGVAIEAAFDDLWERRDAHDYAQSATTLRTPLPPSVPTPVIATLPRPPPPVAPSIPSSVQHTPTLRGSILPPSPADDPPPPVLSLGPDDIVRVPLRELLGAPTAPKAPPPSAATAPSPAVAPLDEPDTIAPPSKYNAWANVMSRPGSPVAPPPPDDGEGRGTPVVIPSAPRLPTRTDVPLATPVAEHPVTTPTYAPVQTTRPVVWRASARPFARVTALPVVSTRGAVILGASIVTAALILAGSHVYVARFAARATHHEPAVTPTHTEIIPPAPLPPRDTVGVAEPVAPRSVPPPAVAPEAVTPAAPREPADALPEHPSDSDVSAVQEHLVTLVGSCLAEPHPSRHVRIRVTYLGATGQPEGATVSGHFGHTPAATCIAAAAREVPIPRFSDARWSWSYIFPAPEP